ncbi:hypothetical protein TREES_T100004366 [Tupaia chinensis]|uniref:C2CD5 C-terminal domain-containing protein n=1 Tax=Tupaia chinensis TaxID=246437 RepID=L9KCV8_TUPCH|nr:hypothetical protein TREES_T100004366 [Tupaia chinensis]
MLMGLASATGVYLAALPTPGGIQIAGKTPNDGSYEQHISHMQKKINDTITKNKELYEINPPIDDTDAMEDVHSLLTDVPPPSGFYSCNTEIMPGINNWTSEIQMFTSVRVIRLSSLNLTNQALNKNFNDLCENLLKEGGVSGFLHAFIAEVFAMVRAHVAALGGNAVVSYIMKQCVFMENPNKNQAQCLINVSGDAVVFVRESDLEVVSTQQPPANCQPLCTGGEVTT